MNDPVRSSEGVGLDEVGYATRISRRVRSYTERQSPSARRARQALPHAAREAPKCGTSRGPLSGERGGFRGLLGRAPVAPVPPNPLTVNASCRIRQLNAVGRKGGPTEGADLMGVFPVFGAMPNHLPKWAALAFFVQLDNLVDRKMSAMAGVPEFSPSMTSAEGID